eukprot:snap_masked-scaffold_2-processed-gene-25.24-mRNA-1 protein AED:1.00 eAED:1.00 QI:0/-1/0/0/-1/1/1/0/66
MKIINALKDSIILKNLRQYFSYEKQGLGENREREGGGGANGGKFSQAKEDYVDKVLRDAKYIWNRN